MTQSNDQLASALDLMQETEAITLDALARVDMASIVSELERDAKEGQMSVGQRKSAHLLLKYYAPMKSAQSQANQSLSSLDSVPIASIITMINALDQRIQAPSPSDFRLPAGLPDDDQVLSDPSREVSSLERIRNTGKIL